MAVDFLIGMADAVTLGAGLNVGFSVDIVPLSTFIGTVTLSVSGGPAGMVVAWPWGNVWNVGGQNAYTNLYVTFDIPLTAPIGVYPVTISGTVP